MNLTTEHKPPLRSLFAEPCPLPICTYILSILEYLFYSDVSLSPQSCHNLLCFLSFQVGSIKNGWLTGTGTLHIYGEQEKQTKNRFLNPGTLLIIHVDARSSSPLLLSYQASIVGVCSSAVSCYLRKSPTINLSKRRFYRHALYNEGRSCCYCRLSRHDNRVRYPWRTSPQQRHAEVAGELLKNSTSGTDCERQATEHSEAECCELFAEPSCTVTTKVKCKWDAWVDEVLW